MNQNNIFYMAFNSFYKEPQQKVKRQRRNFFKLEKPLYTIEPTDLP